MACLRWAGELPDLPAARLLELYGAWRLAPSTDERRAIWHEMFAIKTPAQATKEPAGLIEDQRSPG